MLRKTCLLVIFFVSSFFLTFNLSAAGFSILEQSAAGLGSSLAGMTANTDDPGAVFFNPASSAWIEETRIMLGVHSLIGNVRYSERNSNVVGKQDRNITSPAFVPNLYLVQPLTENLNLNLGISATSGTSTTYRDRWQGRYFALKTEVSVIEISPSLSYKITDELSLGIGLLAQYAKAEMSQAADFSPFGDGQLKLKGDSTAFGYSLGLLYRPTSTTKIGLGWRSKLSHTIDFDSRLRIPAAAAPYVGGKSRITGKAKSDLTLPASANLGIQQEITEKLTLLFDVSWTQWSDMKELKVKFKKNAVPGVNERNEIMKWKDNWRFALGAEYKLNEKWTLRNGVAFDHTPVRNKDLRVAKLPDTNRLWVSLGATYKISEQLCIDAAFTHLFFNKCYIRQTNDEGNILNGSYTGYMNIYSIALQYKI